jgi:hypothetical protein
MDKLKIREQERPGIRKYRGLSTLAADQSTHEHIMSEAIKMGASVYIHARQFDARRPVVFINHDGQISTTQDSGHQLNYKTVNEFLEIIAQCKHG